MVDAELVAQFPRLRFLSHSGPTTEDALEAMAVRGIESRQSSVREGIMVCYELAWLDAREVSGTNVPPMVHRANWHN